MILTNAVVPALLHSVDMLRVADRVDDCLQAVQGRGRVAGCLDAELYVDAGGHGCHASRPTQYRSSLASMRLILIPI